jgi:Radical SAM superfamily/4Fe-4S single cluster domain
MHPMHEIAARGGLNYDETPFLAIWEITQCCDLACKHCRTAAQPLPHPDQLTTAEGKALIDQIAEMHVPIFVFTGGDPLKRADVYELIHYASDKGVKVAVTPSATPLLTRESIFKMKDAGLAVGRGFRPGPNVLVRAEVRVDFALEAAVDEDDVYDRKGHADDPPDEANSECVRARKGAGERDVALRTGGCGQQSWVHAPACSGEHEKEIDGRGEKCFDGLRAAIPEIDRNK